jgi:hypothetical protein
MLLAKRPKNKINPFSFGHCTYNDTTAVYHNMTPATPTIIATIAYPPDMAAIPPFVFSQLNGGDVVCS